MQVWKTSSDNVLNSVHPHSLTHARTQACMYVHTHAHTLTTMIDASKINNRIIILYVLLPASSRSHTPGIGMSANVIVSLLDVDGTITADFKWLIEPFISGVRSPLSL